MARGIAKSADIYAHLNIVKSHIYEVKQDSRVYNKILKKMFSSNTASL